MSEIPSTVDWSSFQPVDRVRNAFDMAWKAGERPRIEDYLGEIAGPERAVLFAELLALELAHRRSVGEIPALEEYQSRFPGLEAQALTAFRQAAKPLSAAVAPLSPVPADVRVAESASPSGLLTAFVEVLRRSGLLDSAQLAHLERDLQLDPCEPSALAGLLVQGGMLTAYQAKQLLQGRCQDLQVDQYVILEPLGEGGMGRVYKAQHKLMRRIVGLKLIRTQLLQNQVAVNRFFREIQLTARLSHPNIISAHHAGTHNKAPFLIMEYAEGINLSQLVKQRGPLRVRDACDYIRQASWGLQHAHECGLIHRDVKPSNLLLASPASVIKVTDFGLARLLEVDENRLMSTRLTSTGMLLGSVDFMAPEQADDPRTVDIRADIYSLGCTLYFLLAGSVPFPGNQLGRKLAAHREAEPQAIEQWRPDVPPGLISTLRKLMAKLPEDRHQTPAEVATALAPFCCERGG